MNILNISRHVVQINSKDHPEIRLVLETKLLAPSLYPYYLSYINHCDPVIDIKKTVHNKTKRIEVRELVFNAIIDITNLRVFGTENKEVKEPFFLIYGFYAGMMNQKREDDNYFLDLIKSKTQFTPLHFKHDAEKIQKLKIESLRVTQID